MGTRGERGGTDMWDVFGLEKKSDSELVNQSARSALSTSQQKEGSCRRHLRQAGRRARRAR